MSLASLLAGAAFTNADVGAVHCLSEVVGGHYDLPHGQICARYLPASAAFSTSRRCPSATPPSRRRWCRRGGRARPGAAPRPPSTRS